jgi:hypothetical protein
MKERFERQPRRYLVWGRVGIHWRLPVLELVMAYIIVGVAFPSSGVDGGNSFQDVEDFCLVTVSHFKRVTRFGWVNDVFDVRYSTGHFKNSLNR